MRNFPHISWGMTILKPFWLSLMFIKVCSFDLIISNITLTARRKNWVDPDSISPSQIRYYMFDILIQAVNTGCAKLWQLNLFSTSFYFKSNEARGLGKHSPLKIIVSCSFLLLIFSYRLRGRIWVKPWQIITSPNSFYFELNEEEELGKPWQLNSSQSFL